MKILLGLLLSGTLCAPLFATNPIDQREKNEKARIRQGVKSGELTRAEARRLMQEQAKIRAQERKAKSNGRISKKEARKLDRSLDKANRDIYRQKHDNQTQTPPNSQN